MLSQGKLSIIGIFTIRIFLCLSLANFSKGGRLRSNAFVSGMPVRKLICVCARQPISTWWIQAVLTPPPNPKEEICNTALERFVH